MLAAAAAPRRVDLRIISAQRSLLLGCTIFIYTVYVHIEFTTAILRGGGR
jgi:hypothetical protein